MLGQAVIGGFRVADTGDPQLQVHYLLRLKRLINLRDEHLEELNQNGRWLLDISAFATYCDCVEVGCVKEAQEIIVGKVPKHTFLPVLKT